MNVRVARQYAALMLCVPTPSAATCAHANRNIQATPEHLEDVETSTSARLLNVLVAHTQFVRTQCPVTIAFALKDTELNQIHKSLVNR